MAHKPTPKTDPARPDPAQPAENPSPVPGRVVVAAPERSPNEPPEAAADVKAPPLSVDLPPSHPLGPPEPQAARV